MKKLFFFELDSKISIYVPSTVNVNQETDNTKQVNFVLSELAKLFGGATSTAASGAYLSSAGELIRENVTICYSNCKSVDFAKHAGKIVEICEKIKNDMRQECVALEFNGQMAWI